MARNIREPIPLPVILAASEGDESLKCCTQSLQGLYSFPRHETYER